MNLRVKAWHLPPRLIIGAYFLNAVLSRGAPTTPAQANSMALRLEPTRCLASWMPGGSPAYWPRSRSSFDLQQL
jgi:hypothetical protein